jgi:capsid protein
MPKPAPRKKLSAPKVPTAKKDPKMKPQASYQGWQSTGITRLRRSLYGSAPQDLRRDMSAYDRLAMIKKCRWAERNSGLFRQILQDVVLYTVGDGIKPQSHADDPEKARMYEDYFNEKARFIDITNRFSFWQAQAIMIRAMFRDGDAFVAKVLNGAGDAKLQLMEAHRVGNPIQGEIPPEGMHDGIQFGPYGEFIAVNVYRSDGTDRQILAQSIMHIVDHEYASGARGVPVLQHSINSVQDEMDLLELEKLAAKDNADVTRVIKKNGGYVDESLAHELGAGLASEYSNVHARMGGKLIALEPGEDFQSFSSNRPSAAWTGFIKALRKEISMGGLPWEFVDDISELGGASVRLITAKAARVFQKYQGILENQMCVPTWGYIIGNAIADGELPDDPNWNKTTWTKPRSVTVDAGRDSAADRADLFAGVKGWGEIYGDRGLDFRTEMKKRAADMAFIAELAETNNIPFELLYMPQNVQPGTIAPLAEDEPGGNEGPNESEMPESETAEGPESTSKE